MALADVMRRAEFTASAIKSLLGISTLTGQNTGDEGAAGLATGAKNDAIAASSPRLNPTAVKTSAYTAAVGELVLCNASGGSFTVKAPKASVARAGATFAIKHVIDPGTNTVTVQKSDTGTDTIDAAASKAFGGIDTAAVFYSDGTSAWISHRGHALAFLDGRYPALSTYKGSNQLLRDLGRVIKRTLVAANESFAIASLRDSTGGYPGRPPYLFAEQLAADYPAYTVLFHNLNDADEAALGGVNSGYEAPVTVQTGTAGADEACVTFTGAGSYSWRIDSTAYSKTADLDLGCKVFFPDWSPAAELTLVTDDFATAGSYRGRLSLRTDGKLQLSYSANGTTLIYSYSTAATSFADGTVGYVRGTLDANDGAGNHVANFYTSTDGITWTKLGNTVTTAGAITLYASTWNWYEFGGYAGTGGIGAAQVGTFYEIYVRNGIFGPLKLPVLVEHWQPTVAGNPGPTLTGAPVLHFFNTALSGEGLADLASVTNLPYYLPDYGIRAVFMSTSHNEAERQDKGWLAQWAAWIASVRALAYEACPVIYIQNPRFTNTYTTIRSHEIRRHKLLVAASNWAIPCFDACQVYLDTGDPSDYVNATDRIHPKDPEGDILELNAWYADMFGDTL